MLNIRPGTYAYLLLELLSVAGELPMTVLKILGDVRTMKALVKKMQTPQKVLFCGKVVSGQLRVLQVSGKGDSKTIRFTRKALPLLDELGSNAYSYYSTAFYNHKFPGTRSHVMRNHRVAEALAMMMAAGVETRPYMLPKLQKSKIVDIVPKEPAFYPSRSIKDLEGAEMNKTMFTRVVGALFTARTVYAVYNTRDSAMRWSGLGEFKTFHHITDIARMNAGIAEFDSAILLGRDAGVALQTLLESDKSRRKEMRFDSIYHHVHFVPAAEHGKALLKLLCIPDWREALLSALFAENMRVRGPASIEVDALSSGTHILSHLDSDIARLVRFRDAAVSMPDTRFEVICFPWQVEFLREYLGRVIAIRILNEDDLLTAVLG